MTIAQELREHLAFIEANTWVNHAPMQQGECCAIERVEHDGSKVFLDLVTQSFLESELPPSVRTPCAEHYNDSLSPRSKHIVIKWFKRAIALAEKEDS